MDIVGAPSKAVAMTRKAWRRVVTMLSTVVKSLKIMITRHYLGHYYTSPAFVVSSLGR